MLYDLFNAFMGNYCGWRAFFLSLFMVITVICVIRSIFLSLSGLIDYAAALFGFDCLGSVFWMLAWRGEGEIAGRLFEKTRSGSLEDDTELTSDFQNVWN